MSENFINRCIDGMLLGDAYIAMNGRFGFNHSIKQQEYFNHKVSLLREHGFKVSTGKSFIPAHEIEHGRTIKEGILISAYCSAAFSWKELRQKWYPNGKKIVPTDLVLTPETLAYWYMDDGTANTRSKYISYHKGKRYSYVGEPFIQQFRFYTDGFDEKSQAILQTKLFELGVDSWYHTRSSGNRYLVISRLNSRRVLKDILYPIISNIPTMLYKIDKKLIFQQERISEKAPDLQDDALFRTGENDESPEATRNE